MKIKYKFATGEVTEVEVSEGIGTVILDSRRSEPASAEMPCENRTVNELLLQDVTIKAFNRILTERKAFLTQMQENIAKAVVSADTLSPGGIQARVMELHQELIKKTNNKQDYDAIADEIFRLREQKEKSEVDSHNRDEAMNRIKDQPTENRGHGV